jgi:leucyl aminopeptidase (aminopeptidase T)
MSMRRPVRKNVGISSGIADPGVLARAANVVLDRLAVDSDSRFLVVANPELAAIATRLAVEARARSDHVAVQEFPATRRDGDEPPTAVAAAMRASTVMALVTSYSLSHTLARAEATSAGARIASLPGITSEIFARTIPVDYDLLQKVGRALASRLTDAEVCRVSAPGGTQVELSLRGRQGISDDGDLREPGAWGNLPAGEAFISPLENEATGTLVFDGSLAGWGLLPEPLKVELERGRLVTASGSPAAKWLLETLDAGGTNGRTIAELGIGTNPNATITGTILEDEKVEGTVHVAFGTNTSIGGANQASVHIDGLIRDALVTLDGHTILADQHLVG